MINKTTRNSVFPEQIEYASPLGEATIPDLASKVTYSVPDISSRDQITEEGTIVEVLGTLFVLDSSAWVPLTGEVYVETFGAKGDGATDDTSAIQAAIDYIANYPRSTLTCRPNKNFKISSTLQVASDLSINFKNSRLIPSASSAILVDQGVKFTTSLDADAVIHTDTFVVNDATGISEGDLVLIKSDKAWYMDPTPSENMKQGELSVVDQITGTTIRVRDPLNDNYDISQENVTVQVLSKVELKISDLRVAYASPFSGSAMILKNLVDSSLTNVRVSNAQVTGISCTYNYNTYYQKLIVEGANKTGIGYGVQLNASTHCQVSESQFSNCRRGVDVSGLTPSRYCRVTGCRVTGDGLDSEGGQLILQSSGVGSHEGSEFCVFDHNVITNTRLGIILRGSGEKVTDNDFYGDIRLSLVVANTAINWDISNNTYDNGLSDQKTPSVGGDNKEQQSPYFIYWQNPKFQGYARACNNRFNNLKNAFLAVDVTNSSPVTSLIRLTLTENSGRIDGSDSFSQVRFIDTISEGVSISDSNLVNNRVFSEKSEFEMYDESVSIDYENTVNITNYAMPVTTVSSGSTNVTVTSSKLILNVDNGVCNLQGYVRFDVAGSSGVVKLEGLPNKVINGIGPSYAWPLFRVSTSGINPPGLVSMPSGASGSLPTSAWISYDQSAYNTPWPVSTGYLVNVDISYPVDR